MRLAEALRSLPILVVDDAKAGRDLLVGLLRGAGFARVEEAAGGEEALSRLLAGGVDLVLLDLVMPGLDGVELCRRARAEPALGGLPILVQTALGQPEDRSRAFSAGATDYLTKPVNPTELVARVRLHLANRILRRELEAARARAGVEVERARRLLARPAGASAPGVSARQRLSPALGGDLWHARDLGGGRVALWVGDCAGHGVAAALGAMSLRALAEAVPIDPSAPGAHLREVSARLGAGRAGRHAALLAGVLDRGARRFVYASAGAPPPIAWAPTARAPIDGTPFEGAPVTGLPVAGSPGGPPLGLGVGPGWRDHVLDLPAGGRLLLRTDGVAEPGPADLREPDAGRLLDALVGGAGEDDATALLAEIG